MTRCNRCGQLCDPIEMHGHTQCSLCGSVLEECCQGETAEKPPVPREEEDGDAVV